MGYFAGRAAPFGPVGPDPVTATFFNFHPDRARAGAARRLVDRRRRPTCGPPGPTCRGPGAAPGGPRRRGRTARALVPLLRALARRRARRRPTAVRRHPGDGRARRSGRGALVLVHLPARAPRGRARGRARPRPASTGARHSCCSPRPRACPSTCSGRHGAGRRTSGPTPGAACVRRGLVDAGGITPEGAALRRWIEGTTDDLAGMVTGRASPGERRDAARRACRRWRPPSGPPGSSPTRTRWACPSRAD